MHSLRPTSNLNRWFLQPERFGWNTLGHKERAFKRKKKKKKSAHLPWDKVPLSNIYHTGHSLNFTQHGGWSRLFFYLPKISCTDIEHLRFIRIQMHTRRGCCSRHFLYLIRHTFSSNALHHFLSTHFPNINQGFIYHLVHSVNATTNVTVWHQCRFFHQSAGSKVRLSRYNKNRFHLRLAKLRHCLTF